MTMLPVVQWHLYKPTDLYVPSFLDKTLLWTGSRELLLFVLITLMTVSLSSYYVGNGGVKTIIFQHSRWYHTFLFRPKYLSVSICKIMYKTLLFLTVMRGPCSVKWSQTVHERSMHMKRYSSWIWRFLNGSWAQDSWYLDNAEHGKTFHK